MLNYDLYIFDWDGTLMNTTQTIVDGTTHACKVLGLNVISDDLARSIIGKSFIEVVTLGTESFVTSGYCYSK